MRLFALAACGVLLLGTAAQACGLCPEEEYAPGSAYISYRGMTPEQQRAADEKAREEARQLAMNAARAAFVSRFRVMSSDSVATVASATEQPAPRDLAKAL